MKLHLIVNTKGEIITWMITSENVSDITPLVYVKIYSTNYSNLYTN